MSNQFFINLDNKNKPYSTVLIQDTTFKRLYPELSELQTITANDITHTGYALFVHQMAPTLDNPFEQEAIEIIPTDMDEEGRYLQKWAIVNKQFDTPEEAEEARIKFLNKEKIISRINVNTKRRVLEQSGVLFSFKDGTIGSIQTRNVNDFRNIQGVVTTAQIMISNGRNDNILQFRDAENIIHDLTPSEAIDIGLAVQQHVTETYQWAWNKKTEIDNATTIEELRSITI